MTFHRGYALATLAVLLIEILIALYVRDALIRPYLGDTLAVVLVYLGLRAITPLRTSPAALAALAIAFTVEIAQYFHLADHLALGPIGRTVLGTGFEWKDFLAYTAGSLLVLAVERHRATP